MAKTIKLAQKDQQKDRREQILDIAETLIRTRGFVGFSYQDIADDLGIRKASIHYYFPSKAGLGLAAIDRYASQIAAMLNTLEADETLTARAMLEAYLGTIVEISKSSDKFCLAGAMAAELMALPEDMRVRVDQFFEQQQDWMTRVIERGMARGEIQSDLTAKQLGRLIFSAGEGAMLITRTSGDLQQIQDVVYALMQQLFGREPKPKTAKRAR